MISQKEKEDLIQNMHNLAQYIMDIPTCSNCLNCDSWDGDKEECKKYKARPPLKTIVDGCPEWKIDIPF